MIRQASLPLLPRHGPPSPDPVLVAVPLGSHSCGEQRPYNKRMHLSGRGRRVVARLAPPAVSA